MQEDKSEAVVSQVKTILQMKWPYALREEVLAVGQIVAAHCQFYARIVAPEFPLMAVGELDGANVRAPAKAGG